jgi:hypothetical protein
MCFGKIYFIFKLLNEVPNAKVTLGKWEAFFRYIVPKSPSVGFLLLTLSNMAAKNDFSAENKILRISIFAV